MTTFNDNLIAHTRFTTSVAPAVPVTTNGATNRQYRCAVTRDGVAPGQYLITLTDPIADADAEISWSVTASNIPLEANARDWKSLTFDRVSDTVYRVIVWEEVSAGAQVVGIPTGLPAYGQLTGDGGDGGAASGAAVAFGAAGPSFGGVARSGVTNGLVLPVIGNYEITWSVPFADPSELALFVDPNTGVFAIVTTSASYTGPDASNVVQPQTVTMMITTTAVNSIVELRNVGLAAIAPAATDGVLTTEPDRSFSAKLLSSTSELLIPQIIDISDAANVGVRVTFRKVSPQ